MYTAPVNLQTRIYFPATAGQTYTPVVVLNGAVVSSPVITVTEVSTGLYQIAYTPNTTGKVAIHIPSVFTTNVDVVSKSIYTYLRNIEDEALGSWSWNKQTNKLQMFTQTGEPLAEFDVVENMTTASRERTA